MASDETPSNKWVFAAITIVFIAVTCVSDLEKALASGVTVGVFGAIIQTKWESRGDFRFWLILAIFSIFHIILIAVVKFPVPRAGLVSLPFALVDGFIIYGLINWIEHRFPRGPGSLG